MPAAPECEHAGLAAWWRLHPRPEFLPPRESGYDADPGAGARAGARRSAKAAHLVNLGAQTRPRGPQPSPSTPCATASANQ